MAQARGTYVIDLDARSAQASLNDFAKDANQGLSKVSGAVTKVSGAIGGIGGEAGKAMGAVTGLLGAFALGPVIGSVALLATGVSYLVAQMRAVEEAAKRATAETEKAFAAALQSGVSSEAALEKELRQQRMTPEQRRRDDAEAALVATKRARAEQEVLLSTLHREKASAGALQREQTRLRTLVVQQQSLERQLELVHKIASTPAAPGRRRATRAGAAPEDAASDAEAIAIVEEGLGITARREQEESAERMEKTLRRINQRNAIAAARAGEEQVRAHRAMEKEKTRAAEAEARKREKIAEEEASKTVATYEANGARIADVAIGLEMTLVGAMSNYFVDIATAQEHATERLAAAVLTGIGQQLVGIGVRAQFEGAIDVAKGFGMIATGNPAGAGVIASGATQVSIGTAAVAAGAAMGIGGGIIAANISGGGGGGGGGSGGSSIARRDRRSRGDPGSGEPSTVTIQYFGGTHLGDTAARVQTHDRDQRRATRNLALPGRR